MPGRVSTASSSSRATPSTRADSSVGLGNVLDLVIVSNDGNRTLIDTVRPRSPRRPQPPPDRVAHPHQLAPQIRRVDEVDGEGLLVADRLDPTIGFDRSVVDGARHGVQVAAGDTDRRHERVERQFGELTDGPDPEAGQLVERAGSDAPQRGAAAAP